MDEDLLPARMVNEFVYWISALLSWQSLEAAVTAVIYLVHDSVVRIDLGPTFSPAAIRTIGRGRSLPKGGPQIV